MALPIIRPKAPGWVQDFRTFIMRGNVVDLAVGIIIGAAFTAIVSSLVKDILNPLIGLATGGVDFSDLFITLKGPVTRTLQDATRAGAVTLNYGVFVNAVVQFLIVAFAVFWLVRLIGRLHVREAEAPVEAVPTPTEALLVQIRDLLAARPSP